MDGAPLFAAFKQMQFISVRNESSKQASTEAAYRRKAMEWFSRKTSIAGVEIPNWGIVLGAVIVILFHLLSSHSLKTRSRFFDGPRRREAAERASPTKCARSLGGVCLANEWRAAGTVPRREGTIAD
jgi:hypothetical protein